MAGADEPMDSAYAGEQMESGVGGKNSDKSQFAA